MPLLSPAQDRPELPADIQIGALAGAPPDLLEMYAYWQRKRGARAMPARADIEPAEIKRLLPGILLVDVRATDGALDFVYRLVGTREVDMRGHDPTGKRVAEAYYGKSADLVTACYRRVVETCQPFLDEDCFHLPGQEWSPAASIYLPLSGDGARVAMILVYSSFRWIAGGWSPDAGR
ncbi:MAG TPA: PAS domain-containing protein [Dongiaceae bacterium]|nr:PAS domain-containing protein [Dongiaceae bacterium]